MKNKINVAVIGATGYTGLDLILMLSKHPKINILYLCATKNLGKKINFFDKRIKKKLPKISSTNKINWSKLDLVYLSLPNGEAQKLISKKFSKNKNLKFIDLSADFRISNYKNYRIISNPGCYPTSVQLPLVPIINKNLIKTNNITIDTKSGFSGAGKNLEKKFTHKNLYNSTFAYGIQNHRHICEIDQQLFKFTNKKIVYTFNPHLLPTFRGILTSIYVYIKPGKTGNDLRKALMKYYKKSKFIKVLQLNSPLGSGNVLNTNNCEISICKTRDKNKFLILSSIDNLVKGASGQAIQNMNLMFKFPEKLGL